MKNYLSLICTSFLFLTTFTLSSQLINKVSKDHNNREILLGKINKTDLMQNSFANWFNPKYNAYKVDSKSVMLIKNKIKKYKIVAFMGTWCGDSKREIPHFYKILESIDYPMKKFTLIAVDNSKENYKKSPNGEEKGLNIKRVPTFIIYKNGKEINRIIESPIISLEKDLAAIVSGKEYIPNYSDK